METMMTPPNDDQPQYRDVNVPLILTIGIVSTLVVVEIILLTQAAFYRAQDELVALKDPAQASWELQDLWLRQRQDLEAYHWIDRDKLTVAIPIDQAMKRYVARVATLPADAPH